MYFLRYRKASGYTYYLQKIRSRAKIDVCVSNIDKEIDMEDLKKARAG